MPGRAVVAAITVVFAALARADTGAACASSAYVKNQATAIVYKNLVASGTYNAVTGTAGTSCGTTPKSYSGDLGPFSEEGTIKLRGPIQLKAFAVYQPGSSGGARRKRDSHGIGESGHRDRSHVKHKHGKRRKHKRGVCPNRQHPLIPQSLQSKANVSPTPSPNDSSPPFTPQGLPSTTTSTTTTPVQQPATTSSGPDSGHSSPTSSPVPQSNATSSAQTVSTGSAADNLPSPPTSSDQSKPTGVPATAQGGASTGGGSSWSQVASYMGMNGTATAKGLSFMTNMGPMLSMNLGNSQAYVLSSGVGSCSNPEVLGAGVTIPSDMEINIASDRPCQGVDCGYTYPGAVAMHGWGGNRLFVFQFQMPNDSAGKSYPNQPAIWMLNSRITNLQQYATDPTCTCWNSGCGELDLFEILCTALDKGTSTFHAPGTPFTGSGSYFQRPIEHPIIFAVMFDQSTIRLKILSSFNSWSGDLTAEDLANISKDDSDDAVTTF